MENVNLIRIQHIDGNIRIDKYLDILKNLNIDYEFCNVFNNSIVLFCNRKKYKIKTLLGKHFNVLNVGFISGLDIDCLDFYVDMDMVVYELELKK